jgi:prevent-host-death family protein
MKKYHNVSHVHKVYKVHSKGLIPMKRLNAAEVRKDLAEALNQVAYAKERIVIHRRGKDVAVLISMEDFRLLQSLGKRLLKEGEDR